MRLPASGFKSAANGIWHRKHEPQPWNVAESGHNSIKSPPPVGSHSPRPSDMDMGGGRDGQGASSSKFVRTGRRTLKKGHRKGAELHAEG